MASYISLRVLLPLFHYVLCIYCMGIRIENFGNFNDTSDSNLIVRLAPKEKIDADQRQALETATHQVGGTLSNFALPVAVDMGNPHLVFFVDDIEALHHRIKLKHPSVSDITLTDYRMKEFTMHDPEGNRVVIGQSDG
mgnify:CR=1 FL=1